MLHGLTKIIMLLGEQKKQREKNQGCLFCVLSVALTASASTVIMRQPNRSASLIVVVMVVVLQHKDEV